MDKEAAGSVGGKISLHFRYFPDFASYVLHNELNNYVAELIRNYEEMDIPIMRFFKEMGADQRRAVVTGSSREMLTLLAANNARGFIDQTITNWLTNQLPKIKREQVHSQDISLINYIRGKVLRKFISAYTADISLWQHLMDEVHRFLVVLDAELYASYIDLQKEQIQQMNEALQKREQQLLEAQDVGGVGSFEWDLVGTQSSYTPQILKIFERKAPTDLHSFLSEVHPDDRDRLKEAVEKAFVDGDYECEYRYVNNNKEKVLLSKGKVLFEDGEPRRMLGTVTDVTERHAIIKKLQESENLHKQAQAITHLGNWSWFINDNRITWSDEMYRIYGLPPQSEEINFERFMSFVDPDDRSRRFDQIKQALKTLKVEEYHFRITTADGVRKVLRGKGEVLADASGTPTVMLGTCQDVTGEFNLTQQLRERERYLEQLNRSLHHANNELSRTNEELESFNFIASHDLQEPLRKIQVYSNRILENGLEELSAPLKDYFERINLASRRMQKLIEDFLAFSQSFDAGQVPEKTDLNAIVEEVKAELITRIEDKHAQIETRNLPTVYAVPFHMKQLIVNLISNALKYTKPDVTPKILISGDVVSGTDVPDRSADPMFTYVKVKVEDNGIGFEPKYSMKIFELFQRLHGKNVYSGTGIGLALCKKIVRHMDGYIQAESVPDEGSVFTFYIPQRSITESSVAGINSAERAHQRG